MPTNWEKVVTGDELIKASKERKNTTITDRIRPTDFVSKEKLGWRHVDTYANGDYKIEKDKPIGEAFENEVWLMLYKMGFTAMNSDNSFTMYDGDSASIHKQIDIIAVDDEVCLLVECKATNIKDNNKTWKTELESINGNKGWLFTEIKKKFPNRKIKYIFATKNYLIGKANSDLMDSLKIGNFDSENVTYYSGLVNHLGKAAKYQLLGALFSGQDIAGMEERIPAIQGKMGGKKYYSFVIEPERMLKISYILHRNKGNHGEMPTYQRLIKKDRLKSIREFVDNGNGYFPNSLIVSIDTKGKGLRFDNLEKTPIPNCHSRAGVLHLPKQYMSAYVIDGQHRLYGYSETERGKTNTIPVVAFEDMDQGEQVKLFMDINEKQKPVPKSLRNTLNINLLWESKNYNERKESLMLSIGQSLGEEQDSPLYGRVVTGEDSTDSKRCITLEYIKDALKSSKFLNEYKKNNDIIHLGTFDKTDNGVTNDNLLSFLYKCFGIIKEYCPEEWNAGNEGFLTINNGTYSLIRIFDCIVNLVLENEGCKTIYEVDNFYEKCEPMLMNLADTICGLSDQEKGEIKGNYGGSGKKKALMTLQVALKKKNPEYTNPELEKHIEDYEVDNNPTASSYLFLIKNKIIEEMKNRINLINEWLRDNCPEKLRYDLMYKAMIENDRKKKDNLPQDASEWDYIDFEEIYELMQYKANYTNLFKDVLKNASKDKTKIQTMDWLKSLNIYAKMIAGGQHIVKSQFDQISDIYNCFYPSECEESAN